MRKSTNKIENQATKEKLATYFLKPTTKELVSDLPHSMLVVIDAEKAYCDPARNRGNDSTDQTCRKIQKFYECIGTDILKTCWVHGGMRIKNSHPLEFVEFHHVKPQSHDFFAFKGAGSAFRCRYKGFRKLLSVEQPKTLFITGFNATRCVLSTVKDALKAGYKVHVLEDLVENDRWGDFRDGKNNYNAFINALVEFHQKTKTPLNIGIIQSKQLRKALNMKRKLFSDKTVRQYGLG